MCKIRITATVLAFTMAMVGGATAAHADGGGTQRPAATELILPPTLLPPTAQSTPPVDTRDGYGGYVDCVVDQAASIRSYAPAGYQLASKLVDAWGAAKVVAPPPQVSSAMAAAGVILKAPLYAAAALDCRHR